MPPIFAGGRQLDAKMYLGPPRVAEWMVRASLNNKHHPLDSAE